MPAVEASPDPDGCWHIEACHPVQHIASKLCFDLLTGQSPGEESPSNDGFVPIHCGLNEASPVVARTTLPAHATMLFDGCNMLIALRHPARTQNRCRPRWDDDVSLSLTLAISGKAEIWSVEYDVVHDTGVEGGTIDGGCKAWIVANTLWIGMSAGEDVGQNILEHWEIDGYDNAAGDSK